MSNNFWGDLIFKLVAIPFLLLLLLMVIHQATALRDEMGEPENPNLSRMSDIYSDIYAT